MFSGKLEGTEYAFALVNSAKKLVYPHSLLTVQLVMPEKVLGELHGLNCIFSTLKAFAAKRNISSDMSLELMIRLSAQRQIFKAVKYTANGNSAVLFVIGKGAKKEFHRILEVLEAEEQPLQESSKELQYAAIERTALLSLGA